MKKEITITEFAKMGGKATFKKHGKDYMAKIGRIGGKKNKKKLSTDELATDKPL